MHGILRRVSTSVGAAGERRRPWHGLWPAVRHPLRFVWTLVGRVADDHILTVAAAMAYYFFLSLFPLVLFVVALVSVLPLGGLEEYLLGQAREFLPAEAYALVEGTIRDLLGRPRHGLVSVGAVLALWTASSAFVAVIGGLARAYRAHEERPWWRVRLDAMGLTVGLSVLMILTFVLGVFGGHLANLVARNVGPAMEEVALAINWTIVVLASLVVVAAIDRAGPARPAAWRWVTPGALVFLGGFAAASTAFSWYVGRFASYNATYGSLGAVIVLLVWMYMLAFFLLLGTEVNALLEELARARAAARAESVEAPCDTAVGL